jgi:hypothetical protein
MLLAEADRKILKEGRWDVYAGSVFSEWNPRVHVCDPFSISGIVDQMARSGRRICSARLRALVRPRQDDPIFSFSSGWR